MPKKTLAGAASQPWKPTELSPDEEQQFRRDFMATPFYREFVERYREEPDLRPNGDFDYRGWWKDGFKGMARDPKDGTIHGPSKDSRGKWLKAPNHPTKWKQEYIERWGVNPDEIGAKSLDDAPPQRRTLVGP